MKQSKLFVTGVVFCIALAGCATEHRPTKPIAGSPVANAARGGVLEPLLCGNSSLDSVGATCRRSLCNLGKCLDDAMRKIVIHPGQRLCHDEAENVCLYCQLSDC